MKPVFSQAKQAPRRIVFAEGEDDRVLRAVQVIVDEGIARPILIGHLGDIERKLEALNLRVSPGGDFDVVNADNNEFFDEHFEPYWREYRRLMERKGFRPNLPGARFAVAPRCSAR
jgi:malate dehydrogenase (oxaloacetate-decarboxylating)(NADP+)